MSFELFELNEHNESRLYIYAISHNSGIENLFPTWDSYPPEQKDYIEVIISRIYDGIGIKHFSYNQYLVNGVKLTDKNNMINSAINTDEFYLVYIISNRYDVNSKCYYHGDPVLLDVQTFNNMSDTDEKLDFEFLFYVNQYGIPAVSCGGLIQDGNYDDSDSSESCMTAVCWHCTVLTCRSLEWDGSMMILNKGYFAYDDESSFMRVLGFDGIEDVVNGHRAEFNELAECIVEKNSAEYGICGAADASIKFLF